MKRDAIFVITALLLFVPTLSAHGALHDRGEGLIYDDVLDVTWIQNANYLGRTMTWNEAESWVNGLVYAGFDDWRLPWTDTSCTLDECPGSEMGHLYYVDDVASATPGLFSDVRGYYYWSGSEDTSDSAKAWRFNFKSGTRGTSSKTTNKYAWAVRDGDSNPPVAPEPVSSVLFISGGAAFAVRRFGGKRHN